MATKLTFHATNIRLLLNDIGHRYEPLPAYDENYWVPLHDWFIFTLGPTSSWTLPQLTELEHSSGGIIERSYPHLSMELRLLFAKLTAIAILIDDSIDDPTLYDEIVQFSRKLYRGEPQQNRMLALYHANINELSDVYGNDAVLRDLAVLPWISYIDGCLMERDIYTSQVSVQYLVIVCRFNLCFQCVPGNADTVLRPRSNGCSKLCDSPPSDGLALNFPHYLRSKSGISEAYAAGIFKSNREQNIPLKKYIKLVPDLVFFIEIMNDILSFHKEEIAGETHNLIHLRTRALASSGALGTGISGEWTVNDTFGMLCDQIRGATSRIDGLLQLERCERKMRGEPGLDDIHEADLALAKQWRGWRDGYISWHFECRRYKLDFLKLAFFGSVSVAADRRGSAFTTQGCRL
ncbi:hypothetical protein B0H17DRAFT_937940 [Mycena rosella]|uniref:Terpenoid synthase n=1 Tax=Mycena rosella TaxID=1033263 RepID=A0AAD7DDP1_MYCRO|nr:hypothetical protein B0H17DRAFT_937940 [Mycena rosella]